jgi:hypothetical protein
MARLLDQDPIKENDTTGAAKGDGERRRMGSMIHHDGGFIGDG